MSTLTRHSRPWGVGSFHALSSPALIRRRTVRSDTPSSSAAYWSVIPSSIFMGFIITTVIVHLPPSTRRADRAVRTAVASAVYPAGYVTLPCGSDLARLYLGHVYDCQRWEEAALRGQ